MISSENLPVVRRLLGTRSSLRLLSTVTTPSFLFQGRRDFVFDIDQAVDAYRLLGGPKRLYVGDFGHSPSAFPGPDLSHVLDLSTRWYDRFLKGMPNGVDKEKPVQVAADPWRGGATSFAAPPKTKSLRFTSVLSRGMGSRGRIVVSFRPLTRTVEQFGAPTVTVSASTRSQWPHLVAVLTALDSRRKETVLSEGGAVTQLSRSQKGVSFKLISDANLLRRGTRLRVYLGATSTVQSIANLLYLKPVPDNSVLAIRSVAVTMPVLAQAISR
jgi:hypothetical protein